MNTLVVYRHHYLGFSEGGLCLSGQSAVMASNFREQLDRSGQLFSLHQNQCPSIIINTHSHTHGARSSCVICLPIITAIRFAHVQSLPRNVISIVILNPIMP